MTHPEHGAPGAHIPFAVSEPIQYTAEEGITFGWFVNPWTQCPDPVNLPKSFMLSIPWLASQFGAKNRLPCTVTGVDVDNAKSIA